VSGRKCFFGIVKPGEWEDPYVGVTQSNIRACFKEAREAAANGSFAVLFFDEIESIGRIRGSSPVGHHSDKFLAAFLAELDGFEDRSNVAVICATNRKDLIDPSLLERISDLEICVQRPDMRAAREIFDIHLPASIPYSPDSGADTRGESIERAISSIYGPNAGNKLADVRLRDGKTLRVTARQLVSGRLIEQVCRSARWSALFRDVTGGEPGLRFADMESALSQVMGRLATTLSPQNAHAYLPELPQDVPVAAVDPTISHMTNQRRYISTVA